MNVESWITVEETPVLAQAAREAIDARLARLSDTERDAFWASIRKAYNTPYNDPVKKPAAPKPIEPVPTVELHLPEVDLPAAALASAALSAEIRAV
jgi:hypothetical protein